MYFLLNGLSVGIWLDGAGCGAGSPDLSRERLTTPCVVISESLSSRAKSASVLISDGSTDVPSKAHGGQCPAVEGVTAHRGDGEDAARGTAPSQKARQPLDGSQGERRHCGPGTAHTSRLRDAPRS